MINVLKYFLTICFVFSLILTPGYTLAQNTGTGPGGGQNTGTGPGGADDESASSNNGVRVVFDNPLSDNISTLQDFIEVIIGAIIQVGSVVLFFSFVYAGFLFVKARGNASDITKAKDVFKWTVLGALIILGAFAILEIIQGTVSQLLDN